MTSQYTAHNHKSTNAIKPWAKALTCYTTAAELGLTYEQDCLEEIMSAKVTVATNHCTELGKHLLDDNYKRVAKLTRQQQQATSYHWKQFEKSKAPEAKRI